MDIFEEQCASDHCLLITSLRLAAPMEQNTTDAKYVPKTDKLYHPAISPSENTKTHFEECDANVQNIIAELEDNKFKQRVRTEIRKNDIDKVDMIYQTGLGDAIRKVCGEKRTGRRQTKFLDVWSPEYAKKLTEKV